MCQRHLSDSSFTLAAVWGTRPYWDTKAVMPWAFSTKTFPFGYWVPLFEPCAGVGGWNDLERQSRKDPLGTELGVRRQRRDLRGLTISFETDTPYWN